MLFLSVLFCISSCFALNFSFDNYSSIPLLKYSFSFTGKNWFRPDEGSELEPKGFKTVEFGNTLPTYWEITAPSGKALTCWKMNDHEKKPIKSILTLESPEKIQRNDLLLDIINGNNQTFIAVITDLDGEKKYTDFIECSIY